MDPAEPQRMKPNESWTIPLHILEWTTISVGFIMAMVVALMH
jgi:hypothetical protein